ncbi:IS91 family transposase [Desulfoluna limicola]
MPKYSVNQIFKQAYRSYDNSHPLPSFKRDAAYSMMVCRTAALGGHVQGCPDGHFHRVWYNSCKHRSCPQCAYIQVETWLEKQKARLLKCPHFHVVFTIPHQLRFLLQMNFKILADILLISSRDTIFELSLSPKRIGAKPGIIAAFHSWQKNLEPHPHTHCLISGGGLNERGEWVTTKGMFLFPYQAARALFRGKMNDALKKALEKDRLILPSDMRSQQFINLLNKLGRKKWNVKIFKKYRHGSGVATYLARYLRGGPIANTRIKQITESHVVFNYGREEEKLLSLPLEEFIRRILTHVPPPKAVLVRSYGLYAQAKKKNLNIARQTLGQGRVELPRKILWQDAVKKSDPSKTSCPTCGKALILTQTIEPFNRESRMNSPPGTHGMIICGSH